MQTSEGVFHPIMHCWQRSKNFSPDQRNLYFLFTFELIYVLDSYLLANYYLKFLEEISRIRFGFKYNAN